MEILHRQKLVNRLHINRSEIKNLNLFFYGFILYMSSLSIAAKAGFSVAMLQGVQLIGLVIFIYASTKLITFRFESRYLAAAYAVYMLWTLVVILRGISGDYEYIKQLLFDSEVGIFLYLVPLIVLFPKNIVFYKRMFEAIFLLNVFYIIYILIFSRYFLGTDVNEPFGREILEVSTKNLSFPGGFVLLTYIYHSKKSRLFALAAISLAVLLAILRARRGLVFMGMSVLTFSYLIYCFVNKAKSFNASFAALGLGLLLVFAIISLNANDSVLFSSFAGRIDDDSRTGVQICLLEEMSLLDWIVGKGMHGQYYCPTIDAIDIDYRSIIETGYLNIMLKGGLISLVLLLIILLPAIFKGLFRSSNILSKGAALWIIAWMMYSHPSTVTTFSFNYLLVWISVGICYSNRLRSMPDRSIKELFWFIEKQNIT